MKRALLTIIILGLLTSNVSAQEGAVKEMFRYTDSLRPMEWHIRYDSTSFHPSFSLPLPDAYRLVGQLKLQPLAPGYALLRIEVQGLPTRIYVLNNIVLQIGGYLNLSNGQSWIYGPYPIGALDARTLSLPLPR